MNALTEKDVRRNALVLSCAQSLGGANPAIVISLGGLVGQMLATDKSLATLPVSLYNLGLALGTIPAAMLMRRLGRRAAYMLGAVIGGVQVSAGLLLLSVSAATSLAEERQRGSLDVLLSTPLSTRSIVLGKWWGAFRGVPPLAILPALIAGALATHTGFAPAPALIGGLILAYGTAITSLGLALATWLPRMGQAIGLTAGLYIVVLIGAVPVGMVLFGDGHGEPGPGIAVASPFWGVGFSSAVFGGTAGPRHGMREHAAWLVFWTIAYGLVAIGLLLATLKTFNRCLGRADGR